MVIREKMKRIKMVVGVSLFSPCSDPCLSVKKSEYMSLTEQVSFDGTYAANVVSFEISLWVTTRTRFL